MTQIALARPVQHLVTLTAPDNMIATLALVQGFADGWQTVTVLTILQNGPRSKRIRLEDGDYIVRYYDPREMISSPVAAQMVRVAGADRSITLYEGDAA